MVATAWIADKYTMTSFTETHTRTTAKTIVYRLLSIVIAGLLTWAYGGTVAQAFKFGVASLLMGLALFYIYDRIWIRIPWSRNATGRDSRVRTLVKSILYRTIAWLVVIATARVMWADTNLVAVAMASTQFVVNLACYFATERAWNLISWGKVVKY